VQHGQFATPIKSSLIVQRIFSGSKLAQGWEHCSVVSLVLLGVGLSLLFALSFWLQFGPLGKGLQLQAH